MSDNLYMTVCSKIVLFQFIGQMNNSFNHINGIKVFSCTEPPGESVGRTQDWRKRFYFFSGIRKTAQKIGVERWLDSIYGNFINDVPWGGWEGGCYFLKTKQRLYYLPKTVKSDPLLSLTRWRG